MFRLHILLGPTIMVETSPATHMERTRNKACKQGGAGAWFKRFKQLKSLDGLYKRV